MRRPSAVRAVLVCSRWSRAWIWSLFDSTCAEQNRKKEKKQQPVNRVGAPGQQAARRPFGVYTRSRRRKQ